MGQLEEGGVKEPIDCNRGNDVIKAVVERKEVLIARDKVEKEKCMEA